MKICPKCNSEHNKKGSFCSRICANSRSWSTEDKLKKSESAKNSEKLKIANKKIANNPDRIQKYKDSVRKRQEANVQQILQEEFENLTGGEKRIRIYYEQELKCNCCKNDKWMDQKIPLELEHKDGNNSNNERENLELLCPNCHALTTTWRGRNKKGQRPKNSKISDETLLNSLIRNEWNMRQALLEVGLAAKGANYPRCHRIKKEFFET